MAGRPVPLPLDGSPASAHRLSDALAVALDGGPAVLPVGPDQPPQIGAEPDPGIAVIITTSGSTGEPKLVALPAAALRASATASADRLGGPGRWLLALPAEPRGRGAGDRPVVAGRVRAGRAGPARRVPSGRVRRGQRRARDGRAPLHQPGPHPAGPPAGRGRRGARRRCAATTPCSSAGPRWTSGLRARAIAAGVRVVTTYGMSETAGGCVYDGVPLDGVRVRLDAEGGIQLGGPTLASGYLGQPELTRPRSPTVGSGPATTAAGGTAGSRCSAGSTT